MGEQRNWACSYLHSYFDNAWSGPDVTAQAALDQAKAAAVRDLQRKIELQAGITSGTANRWPGVMGTEQPERGRCWASEHRRLSACGSRAKSLDNGHFAPGATLKASDAADSWHHQHLTQRGQHHD